MPDLLDFLLYCFYNSNFKADNLGGKRSTAHLCNMGISLLEYFRRTCRRELERSTHFLPPARIQDLASMAKHYVSLGNQTGEGWFLTGEMLELIHSARRTSSAPSRSAACQTTSSEKASSKDCAPAIRRRISSP